VQIIEIIESSRKQVLGYYYDMPDPSPQEWREFHFDAPNNENQKNQKNQKKRKENSQEISFASVKKRP
jgi:hypothetical protein